MNRGHPLSILMIADVGSLSAFVPALASAFTRELRAHVRLQLQSSPADAAQTALATLLSLEKMLLRRNRPCWADRIAPSSLREWTSHKADVPISLIVDLTSKHQDHDLPVLRPVFNGGFGEEALASSVFFSGTPKIEITLRRTASNLPVVLCEGTASLEAATGVGGAMEAVWSRAAMLMVQAIRNRLSVDRHEPLHTAGSSPAPLSMPAVLRYSISAVAKAAAQAAYTLCCHRGHWRIGWRFADTSNDVWSHRSLAGVRWNVLQDPIDHFYADPFPVFWHGKDYIFFEDLDHKTGKGIISVVEFDSSGRPGTAVPVLEEPWHLSYPFMIEAEGELWMIPEASQSGQVTVYRAANFPWSWEPHAVLVSGTEAADATIANYGGRLWMFAVVRNGFGGYSDALSLWSADQLLGDWHPHEMNPVLIDDRLARPAGAMVVRDGHLMRPVQDCRNGYGAALSLARVTMLNDSSFKQVVETVLVPGTKAWPGHKVHTLNSSGRLEAIDGGVLRPRFPIATEVAKYIYRPQG
ncbi:hypothetical protein [Pseudorhizobium flavum]|uniref:Glucosamine inositolphosphorylceramide transferase 1 N-terminal domain-containing protein n=1 Tax=Pseudorhizobium flavum TaxID=1335061 RepID=A0A7W9Z1S8_9HYPH|nr:hypothetical protein [Pseudorhizobium flavum]MBB6182347.1 hypothetical protein [Pseudorhizobium flavum]CAD6632033.1 formyl transferase [Pseudorhizobium flavum]